MFLRSDRTLDVSYHTARARLAHLVRDHALTRASRAAYQQGLDGVMRVGPIGSVPGASKLVRVLFLDPVDHGATMTVAFRWEAAGATTGLFPVLDADITLSPDGEEHTCLVFVGSYRAPLGRLGTGLDKAILHLVATATIRALLADIAEALSTDAVVTAQSPVPPALRPGPALGT